MIESLLNTVLDKLTHEAFKKFTQIREVGEKVEKVKRELGRLQAFLKDADRKKIKSEGQMHWVKELMNVAYDLEDAIDNALLLQVVPQGNTSNTKAFLSKFKPQKLHARSKLSDQIDQILERIVEISNSRERYGIHNLGDESGEEIVLPLKPYVLPDIDDPNVVGFDSHKESIEKMLLDQNTKSRSVVSIVGIGGLGKTTLARKVYNSTDVEAIFNLRMWVTVSQKFELIDVVRKILEQIRRIDSSEERKQTQYFLTQIYRSLEGKKYFLVLDDVWTDELWDHIQEALVDANNGSRVLITSRDENVARAANPCLDPYKLPLLSEEQGLQLLLKKAHYNPDPTNDAYSHDLVDIARKLVKKCSGLPLALVVLGGLLSRNPTELVVWSNFLQTMSWSTDGSRCANILATSYDDLPLALKFCFMYFAAFPEDYQINATELIRMWVAEEFIPQERNRTLEDTAYRFLNDLVQRSMVQVSDRDIDHFIKYCHVHDLLRDLAVEKAKEANFLTVCSKADEEQSCHAARRVAVHYSECDGLLKCASPSLRTLLCFNSPPPNCSGNKLLRVLANMKHWNSTDTRPNQIEGLAQLRFIRNCGDGCMNNGAHFAKSIVNMKFLQTLDLSYYIKCENLSDSIWDIETLRHVMLPSRTFGPRSGSNLRNLQTLTGITNRESWEATRLPNLPNLRTLKMGISARFSWQVVVVFLHKLKSLVNLVINGNDIPVDILDMRGFPFYQQLTSLELSGLIYLGPGVTVETAMFPINLTLLRLGYCDIRQDLMAVLEKLYNLKYLDLTYGINDYPEKIRCSASGFPRLLALDISKAKKLEEWEIEEGAMPRLKHLGIELCPMLRVPLWLQFTTLDSLTWDFEEDQSATTKAEEIRNLCAHVPRINIIGV